MLRRILVGAVGILASSAMVAYAGPKEEVQEAAKKLADAESYSWHTEIEAGGNFRPGPTEGKMQKDGLMMMSMSFGDNETEVYKKGDKVAVKGQDGWKSLEELNQGGDGQPGPGRFIGRMIQGFESPAKMAGDLAGKVKELKMDDGVYSGDLTEEGAKELLAFRRGGRRGGNGGNGNGPEISNAKGNAKFWVKDGVLTKVVYQVEGTMSFNGNDRDVDRTTTTEFKDVGSTKIEVPAEAQEKMK